MILRQFLHTSPAIAASFYLDAAAALGMQIRSVIDTHVHADHVSTGRALALVCEIPAPPPQAAATRARNLGKELAAA